MNKYHRVYRDFIRDRLGKPPVQGEGTQEHHIQPRCMFAPGDPLRDSPQNLIQLTHGDHFFAHLCLAKAYAGTDWGPNLWSAVVMMLGLSDARERESLGIEENDLEYSAIRGRRHYIWLRELDRRTGLYNGNADQTVYHWSHDDGTVEYLTRCGMVEKYQHTPKYWTCLVSGRNLSLGGWMLHSKRLEFEQKRRMDYGKSLTFIHTKTGEEFTGTQAEFTRHIGSASGPVSHLISGVNRTTKGWVLKDRPSRPSGRRREIFVFVHPQHGEFTGTRSEFCAHSGAHSSAVTQLTQGRNATSLGWRLKDVRPPSSRVKRVTFTFVHPQHPPFVGTRREFARYVDVHFDMIYALVRGTRPNLDGWQVKGKEREPLRDRAMTFIHPRHPPFTGTRKAFAQHIGVPDFHVHSFIRGKRAWLGGWNFFDSLTASLAA